MKKSTLLVFAILATIFSYSQNADFADSIYKNQLRYDSINKLTDTMYKDSAGVTILKSTKLVTNGCETKEVSSTITWNGSVDHDWNNPDNWDENVVPVSTDDVIIPSVIYPGVYPELSSPATCASINQTDGYLWLTEAGSDLTVTGNYFSIYANIRIYNHNTLTVGGDFQHHWEDLVIFQGGKLSVGGKLINSGNVFIYSYPNEVGSIILNEHQGIAFFYGALEYGKWHIISSPVSGVRINTFLQLVSNNISYKDAANGDVYAMMDYNEATNTWNPYFNYTSPPTDYMKSGKGYAVRRIYNGNILFRANLFTGDLEVALSKEGVGWNCVGNPYSSAIGITSRAGSNMFLETNSTQLDPSYCAIYIWDEQADYSGGRNDYKIICNAGFTLDQDYVQSCQGFMVKANSASSSIQFTTAMQVHQPNINIKSGEQSWPGFKLIVKKDEESKSTIITFHDGMTTGLDPSYDAGLFKADSGFALCTRLVGSDNQVDFGIQCLPDHEFDKLVIPVGLNCDEADELVFSVETINLPDECQVILEDRLTNIFTKLDQSGSFYSTQIVENTSGTGRFFIHTSTITTSLDKYFPANQLNAYAIKNEIRISGKVSVHAVAALYDLSGRKMKVIKLQEMNINVLSVSEFINGIYLLNIQDEGKQFNFKILINK